MLFSKPRNSLQRHSRLICLSCRNSLATNSSAAHNTVTAQEKASPMSQKLSVNDYGVPLLPENLRSKLFSQVRKTPVTESDVRSAQRNLTKFGLRHDGKSEFQLPDITERLPRITNNNISHHMMEVATRQVRPYSELVLTLLSSPRPPRPSVWSLRPGWTRYSPHGSPVAVDVPLERCLVLDVEVAVKEDPRAVMATAVSDQAWYSWLSPHLTDNKPFQRSPVTVDSMIPLGSDDSPRLVIGHNVGYDRIRLGDEYRLERSGTRYLDTMALHITVAGMTSQQRLIWNSCKNLTKEELKHKPRWLKKTSSNNLADVYKFYCGEDKVLNKDVRNSFVELNMAELREDCHHLLEYCAGDVTATLEVLRAVYPLFTEHCPHPATLAGMLIMSTSFLPTSNCWENFLDTANKTYKSMEDEMMELVKTEAEISLMMIMDSSYKQDPWLWDMEWKIASLRTIKGRLMKEIHAQDTDLRQLFEEGYPRWYQDLADEKDDKVPYLNLSTSKRAVAKLLRLTWKGYPLHHHKTEKWGYLIPTADCLDVIHRVNTGEIETDFPLEQYYNVVNNYTMKKKSSQIGEPEDILSQISESSDEENWGNQKKTKRTSKKTSEVGIDIGIPGVRFCGLPHKNGPKFRVGNPLGKDFLSSVAEGGDLASYKDHLAEKLLKINMSMSYWRSSRDRIEDQLKVDFAPSQLESEKGLGAILPQMAVAGTITRRAVEKTWLTASNAKADRIGSELKCYIRAPPGYHMVGADVDSQELWLASILGDASAGHGSTPLGWMCLQGHKADGTDLHSKTAAAAQVTRDQAKTLNYGRIYGAGEPFARLLLMQFNPTLTETEVAARAKHMYQQTKGSRAHILNERGRWVQDNFSDRGKYGGELVSSAHLGLLANIMANIQQLVKIPPYKPDLHYNELTDLGLELLLKLGHSPTDEVDTDLLVTLVKAMRGLERRVKSDIETRESLVSRVVWKGGSESTTFNKLEEIATNPFPTTPVLKANITRALDTRLVGRNFLTSRINWVVQSSAVDFLHLLLVTMEWLFECMQIRGRFVISIHDEVRYLVVSEDRYKAALALHLANLLVRAEVSAKLGLDNLPASAAFFSSVDVDTVLRKEPEADCVTPSNRLGLKEGHGIPHGEGLDIWQTLEKLMSQHEAGVMSQLRTMIERPPYWDLLVVCRDGSLQQNKALLVVVFPFLRDYTEILDTNSNSATVFLPDFETSDILSAVRKPFSGEQTPLPDFVYQNLNNTSAASSQNVSGKTAVCNLCGKVVMKTSLTSHRRLHNTTKFSCNICHKQFVRESQLKTHSRKHTGDLPFSCEIGGCNKKFFTKQGCDTHRKICGKEIPKFTCVECNRGFYTDYKLKLHSLVHSGKKDFPCVCGKLFSRKDNLKAHMKRFCITNKIH